MKHAIGRPVPRKEDLRLITGRGTYVSDVQLPRTKHAASGPCSPAETRRSGT